MGKHSLEKRLVSPAEARQLERAVRYLPPAAQRAAIGAAFEGAKQARERHQDGE